MTAPEDSRGFDSPGELAVGDEPELEIGPVAHGGVCVARHRGRVVFVRYALPGERAVVRITEVRLGSFCRGEAVTILRADPRRVTPPCAHFGPGGCGGCDWMHASADLQRELKAAVIAEQLRRLAGIEMTPVVEELPGAGADRAGFGWRSRVRWAVGRPGGRDEYDVSVGPRRYRSHDVVPVDAARPCLIAAPDLSEAAAARMPPAGSDEVVLVRRDSDRPAAAFLRKGRAVATDAGGGVVREQAFGRTFAVAATGFWQAHERAADTFARAVDEALSGFDLEGGFAWDLYGGVGLFAAVLAGRVGPRGRVTSVESDRAAAALAAGNLADLPQVRCVADHTERFLTGATGAAGQDVDAVVLDPPRSGAGGAVCRGLAERHPRVIVYVACDPAALARDTATLGAAGYQLGSLRAFDAFPQTHHVECVAVFTASRASSAAASAPRTTPAAPPAGS